MVSIFSKCHLRVECSMTCSFSAIYIFSSFPQDEPSNITHSRLIYYFYSTRCYKGLATLAMLLFIMTLHLVLDDANARWQQQRRFHSLISSWRIKLHLPYCLLSITFHVISSIYLIPLHFQKVQLWFCGAISRL